MRHVPPPAACLAALALCAGALSATPFGATQAPDIDSDGDGLSDFRETHKYFTDPGQADSDDHESNGDPLQDLLHIRAALPCSVVSGRREDRTPERRRDLLSARCFGGPTCSGLEV